MSIKDILLDYLPSDLINEIKKFLGPKCEKCTYIQVYCHYCEIYKCKCDYMIRTCPKCDFFCCICKPIRYCNACKVIQCPNDCIPLVHICTCCDASTLCHICWEI